MCHKVFQLSMLQNVFKELKQAKLAAAEKAWIDDYTKAQQTGMGLPGGSFTVR